MLAGFFQIALVAGRGAEEIKAGSHGKLIVGLLVHLQAFTPTLFCQAEFTQCPGVNSQPI